MRSKKAPKRRVQWRAEVRQTATFVAGTLYIWQTNYTIGQAKSVKPRSLAAASHRTGTHHLKLPPLSKLGIVLYPDPILKKKAEEVMQFGQPLRALADRMFELMREDKGVGLAAPQVGVGWRMFVCNPTGEPADDLICVNPKLVELSGAEEKEEGCLSIPGVTVTMRRAVRAVMQAVDIEGRPFQLAQTDLPARIWQHEIDHLDGRLIIDSMSPADEIANRRALKQLREQYKVARKR